MTRQATFAMAAMGLLALCLGTCCGSSAQAKRKGPNYNMTLLHPSGQDLEVALVKVSLDLDDQGKLTRREERHQKVLTEEAVDAFGDPRVFHNAARQKLSVTTASTTMRDGTEVKTQQNGINETLPFALEHAPAYTSHRETVVTHVGLERLSTTHLAYEIADTAARPFPLHLEIPVAFPGPAKEITVRVSVPAATKILHECVGCKATPSQSSDGGRTTLTWTLSNVAAYHAESGHGAGGTPALGQPRLVLSDTGSWADVASALGAQVNGALEKSEKAAAKARSLTADSPTAAEKVERLSAFVADAIGTLHYEMSVMGWQSAAADEVLERGYGHTLDKAVLLAALLRAVGLDARPLLISRDRDLSAAVPSLAQFSEVWVQVKLAGQERWLSAEKQSAGSAHALLGGRWAFDLAAGSPAQIAGLPPTANLTSLTAELTLAEDLSVKGKAALTMTGTANPWAGLRAQKKGPDGLGGKLAARVVSGGSASAQTLGSFDERRTSLEAQVAAKPLVWESNRYLRLPIADVPGFLPETISDLAREHRSSPLVLRSAVSQRAKITWRLPEGMAVRALPAAIEVKNDVGRFALSIEQKAGAVTVTRELVIADGWVAAEKYEALLALMRAAQSPAGRVLVLERDLP